MKSVVPEATLGCKPEGVRSGDSSRKNFQQSDIGQVTEPQLPRLQTRMLRELEGMRQASAPRGPRPSASACLALSPGGHPSSSLLSSRNPGPHRPRQGSHLLAVILKPVPDLVSFSVLPDKPLESLLLFFLPVFPLGAF